MLVFSSSETDIVISMMNCIFLAVFVPICQLYVLCALARILYSDIHSLVNKDVKDVLYHTGTLYIIAGEVYGQCVN